MENLYFSQNDKSKIELVFEKMIFNQDSPCVFHNQKKWKDVLQTRAAFR